VPGHAAICESQDWAQMVVGALGLQRGLVELVSRVVVELFGGERRQMMVCPALKSTPNTNAIDLGAGGQRRLAIEVNHR